MRTIIHMNSEGIPTSTKRTVNMSQKNSIHSDIDTVRDLARREAAE
jgi:hypothetical protein